MTKANLEEEAENKRLEKENIELNDKLKNLASVAEVRLGMWQKYEKENTELKSIADFQTSSNMDRYFQLKRCKEKLAEAKDIIKKFLLWENAWHNKTESKYELLEQAEKFLEVEK